MDRLEAALGYLHEGYSVIPCLPNDKKPAIKWQEFQARQPTETEVTAWFKAWPDSNLGIVTGKISGLTVLDVDGETGQRTIEAMTERPQPTRIVKTPKGWHFYYKYRADLHTGANFKPGLDIRSDGGYVVAPPSSINGMVYKLTNDRTVVALTLDASAFSRNGPKPQADTEHPTWVADALASGVVESQRNDMATRLAGYFHSRRIPKDIIISTLKSFAERCQPPMPERELIATVESVFKYPLPDLIPKETPIGETVISPAGVVSLLQDIAGQIVRFEAQDVREERTGPHAHVHLFFQNIRLAHSVINLWRDEDRVRLVNSAYSHLTKNAVIEATYSKSQMKVDLDSFLLQVEDMVERV